MKSVHRIAAMVGVLAVALSPCAQAADTKSHVVNVSATVLSDFRFNLALFKNSTTGAVITNNTMDYGALGETTPSTGTLRSLATSTTGTGSVVALLSVVSSSRVYSVTQTGTILASGANTLPAGACTFVPVYAPEDNGGAPLVGTLGTMGSWVGPNKTIYNSDSNGSSRLIQAYYSITDDPAAGATAGVPLNQAAGTYTGTVTFTATI